VTLDRAMNQLRIAEHSWQTALRQHVTAPPDPGYPRRLRDLAAREGLGWTPLPPAERPAPHELTPSSGRPGPPELWEEFDQALEDLSRAFEGISIPAIARAFGEISVAARALSAAIAAERGSAPARVHRSA